MSDVEISYQTVVEEPRTGPVGKLLRWVSQNPLWAGLAGGLVAVVIAVIRVPGALRQAPLAAVVISAVVVAAWIVLVFVMRSFFARQAIQQIEVRRDIIVDESGFRWEEDGAELTRIVQPDFALYSTEVPEHILESRHRDQPWPVWLVVSGPDTRFVMESKITASEASRYPTVDDAIIEQTDESLPTGLASPLMNCAERRASEDA